MVFRCYQPVTPAGALGCYQPERWGVTSRSAGVLPAGGLGRHQPECWGVTSRIAEVPPAGVLGRCQLTS